MSNISNATSTRAGKVRSGLTALVLVIIALIYAGVALPWVHQVFAAPTPEEQSNALASTEAVAETVEEMVADAGGHDLQTYTDLREVLFADDDALAYVRVWDADAQLACEMARDLPQPRAGNGGRLPDLGVQGAVAALQPRLRDARWMQTVADLQDLLRTQQAITERLDTALLTDDARVEDKADVTDWQQAALEQAQSFGKDGVALDDVAEQMQVTCDFLTAKAGGDLSVATDASLEAENGISAALAEFRAHADATPALPAVLAAVEPGAHWPLLRARRILIPLVIPANTDLAVTHGGYVEVGFYDRDPQAMLALAAAPAVALVLFALVLLALGGKRTRKDVEEAELS